MTSSHCFTAPQITRLSTKKFRVLLKEFSTTHELDWCIFTASKKMNWINFQTNLSSWQLFGLGTVWIKINSILCCNGIPDNLSPQQFFPPSLQYNHILPCVSNDIFWGGCGGRGASRLRQIITSGFPSTGSSLDFFREQILLDPEIV